MMPEDNQLIVLLREQLLSHAASETERAELLARLSSAGPAERFAGTLRELAREMPVDVLGYAILPGLRDWLERSDGRTAAQVLAGADDTPPALRLVLLDFLDTVVRLTADGTPDPAATEGWWASLRQIAADRGTPSEVRAKATRMLHRDASPVTTKQLSELVRDRVGLVADEAALATARAGRPAGPGARPPVTAAALRALVESGDRTAVLRAADDASTADEHAVLLCAAGDLLPVEHVATFVSQLATSPGLTGVAAVRGFLGPRPERLTELYDAGHADSFVLAATLLAGGFSTATRERLVAIVSGGDRRLGADAASLLDPDTLPPSVRMIRANGLRMLPNALGHYLDQNRLEPLDPSDIGHVKRPFEFTGLPFPTGLHLGDAIYRDLVLPGTHWHAGIYEGFVPGQPSGFEGTLWAINAAGGIGWSDTIVPAAAYRSLSSPGADLASQMRFLLDDFVLTFQEGHPDKTFHGGRAPLAITAAQRVQVANTAAALQYHNIWWTWVDQLDYKWWDWDGSIDDIDESRCDGVVEYSYEANGLRVCGGTDPTLFDIAIAGTEHVENHNNFHNGAYQPGELCPRIQAGDLAHVPTLDTTLIATAVTPPALADVQVFGVITLLVPSIWFRVVAPAYEIVYVRITVSLAGGPWHTVVTDDPYGNTSTLVGGWRWHPVPANTQASLYTFWEGQTDDGTAFAGQDGAYTFRLVAIDRGGNVSATVSRTVTIAW
jgi:hypothetical protein